MRSKAEPVARAGRRRLSNRPKTQEEDDKEDRRNIGRQRDRAGRGREGVAGIRAGFHLVGDQIMLDPVRDDPELRDQHQNREQFQEHGARYAPPPDRF